MYEMYPEWGPARHRHDGDEQPMSTPTRRPRYWERELVAVGTTAGDADGDRPEDN